jgi:hypothetical protein
MLKIFKFFKDMLLFVPLTLIFAPLSKLFLFLAYFNKLLLWIYQHKNEFIYCDYFSPLRDYTKRFKLYEFIADHFKMEQEALTYLEFGVASGSSFKWWLAKNKNTGSGFYGFDTFEGLPEDWGGFYVKGDMSHGLPEVNDSRAAFIKGLFQDTLSRFIAENNAMLNTSKKKVIHMDADLYSATIFALSQLYPYLKKGDLILFDEFNVAMHEFKAYLEFTGNFYIKLKPVAAVNNFYQTAFVVE